MPRPIHPPLTDRAVRAVMPGELPIDLRDGELRGLILTIQPGGKRQWTIRYRARDERKNAIVQRRAALGTYPAMTIAVARKVGRSMQSAIDGDRDPVAERREAAAVRTDTVDALALEYLSLHARKKKRTAAEDERVLNVYVLPGWRKRSVREITRRDVRTLIEGIAERAPIMANRVLEIVRKMFNFGIGRDWLDGNPASRVEKPGVEQRRERVLTDDEIRRLWALLERFPSTEEKQAPGRKRAKSRDDEPFCPLSPALAAVQKLRLLTAQRGGEVVRMRWSDLDLKTGWWTIPAEHAKNGRPHRVPLVAEVVAIVEAQERDVKARTDAVFVGRGGAIPIQRVKKAGAACARALNADIRSHDLRRTAATRMTAAGIPGAHVSHVLNHVQGGPVATRTYDRHGYDAEKRLALETWARVLRDILANVEKSGASVVPLTRRA